MRKAVLIIQARMSSSRLPGKMTMNLATLPLYLYVYKRCEEVKGVETVIMATSTDPTDDVLADAAIANGLNIYRGSLNNVLKRHIDCARAVGADAIVRVCGDSPFVDARKAGELLGTLVEQNLDHVDFGTSSFVKGLDSEAVRLEALERSLELSTNPNTLEHVTYFIRQNPSIFNKGELTVDLDPFEGRLALTIDTKKDLTVCQKLAEALTAKFGPHRFDFSSDDIFSIFRHLHLNLQRTQG